MKKTKKKCKPEAGTWGACLLAALVVFLNEIEGKIIDLKKCLIVFFFSTKYQLLTVLF